MKVGQLNDIVVITSLKNFIKRISSSLDAENVVIACDKNDRLVMLCQRKLISKAYIGLTEITISQLILKKDKTIEQCIVGHCDYYYESELLRSKSIFLDEISVHLGTNIDKGYGSLMIKYLQSIAKKSLSTQIKGVFVPFFPGNESTARNFYLRNGFKFIKSRENDCTFIIKKRYAFTPLKTTDLFGINFSLSTFKQHDKEDLELL